MSSPGSTTTAKSKGSPTSAADDHLGEGLRGPVHLRRRMPHTAIVRGAPPPRRVLRHDQGSAVGQRPPSASSVCFPVCFRNSRVYQKVLPGPGVL